MSAEPEERPEWILVLPSRRGVFPSGFTPQVDRWADIDERRSAAYLSADIPILVRADGKYDRRILRYFRRGLRRGRAAVTATRHAASLRMWLEFLERQSGGPIGWDEAQPVQVEDWRYFRLVWEGNGHAGAEGRWVDTRVEPKTWNNDVDALHAFYAWAVREGHVEKDLFPVTEKESPSRPGGRWADAKSEPGSIRSRAGRSRRDRWFTPSWLDLWIKVGLLDYTAQTAQVEGRTVAVPGLRDATRREQVTATRNVAFARLTYSSMLRRRESGTLLLMEVPDSVGEELRIGSSVAKGGKPDRGWTVLDDGGIRATKSYINGPRHAAVKRAQRQGRYEELGSRKGFEPLVVSEFSATSGGLVAVFEDGTSCSFDALTQDVRLRLFRRDQGGALEPLMVWLSESGLPMNPRSWNDVCEAANDRVTQELRRIGMLKPHMDSIRVTPHSMRFSFALVALARQVQVIDRRLKVDPAEPFDVNRYMDAFAFVQVLMGHADVQTTIDTYLEPVRGMRFLRLHCDELDVETWLDTYGRSQLILDTAEPLR